MEELPRIQITNLGWRFRADVLDLIVGFSLFGPITEESRVQFFWNTVEGAMALKVRTLWCPTLLNTQGFREGVYGPKPFCSRPFTFPDKFEICGGDRVEAHGESIRGLTTGSIFLVCFTLTEQPPAIRLVGEVSPEPTEHSHE